MAVVFRKNASIHIVAGTVEPQTPDLFVLSLFLRLSVSKELELELELHRPSPEGRTLYCLQFSSRFWDLGILPHTERKISDTHR